MKATQLRMTSQSEEGTEGTVDRDSSDSSAATLDTGKTGLTPSKFTRKNMKEYELAQEEKEKKAQGPLHPTGHKKSDQILQEEGCSR